VCGFCGVSYLVFSEVKELEKKLVSALEDAAKCRQLEARVQFLEAENQKNVADALSKHKELNMRAVHLESENSSLLGKIKDLGVCAEGQQKMIEQLRQRLAQSDANLQIKVTQSQEAEQNMGEVNAKISEAMDSVDTYRTKCHESEQELKREHSKRQSTQLLNERLKRKLKVVQTFLQLEKSAMAEIKQEVANSVSDSIEFLAACTEKISSEKLRFERLSVTFYEAKTSFENQILDLNRKNKELLDRTQILESLNKKTAIECTNLQTSLDAVRSDLQHTKEARQEELSHQLSTKETEIETAHMQLQSLKNEIVTFTRRQEELSHQLSTKETEIETAHVQLQSLKSISEKYERTAHDKGRELEATLLRVESLQNENKALNISIGRAESKSRSLELEMDDKVSRLLENHEAELETIQSEHSCSIQKLQVGFDENFNMLSFACASHEKNANAISQELESVKTENMSLRAQMDEVKASRQEYESMKLEMAAANKALQKQLSFKTGECKKLAKQNGELQQQIDENHHQNRHDIDKHGLEGLERTLIKLSGQVRQKDKEVERLEGMVHKQCEERMVMLIELNAFREAAASQGHSKNEHNRSWKGGCGQK
jgi:chromosome segregation ATPase